MTEGDLACSSERPEQELPKRFVMRRDRSGKHSRNAAFGLGWWWYSGFWGGEWTKGRTQEVLLEARHIIIDGDCGGTVAGEYVLIRCREWRSVLVDCCTMMREIENRDALSLAGDALSAWNQCDISLQQRRHGKDFCGGDFCCLGWREVLFRFLLGFWLQIWRACYTYDSH